MNEEHFEKWMQALESEEYPQATGHLEKWDLDDPERVIGYCCLGVGCKVAGIPIARGDGLPRGDLIQWLGLQVTNFDNTTSAPTLEQTYTVGALGGTEATDLNDGRRLTFPEIAAWMRKHKDRLVGIVA